MAHSSPLLDQHVLAEASLIGYGPLESQVELVETFGELDLEYAAVRKACGLLDGPHRGTLEIVGEDRFSFLNSMVTQELRGLEPGRSRRSFWLNRRGRIEADLRLTELGDRLVVDLDVHAVERTVESLSGYVIADDVEVRDVTDRVHRLALHGPTGPALLSAVGERDGDGELGGPIEELSNLSACVLRIAGHEVLVERADSAGTIGLELSIQTDGVVDVYRQLVESGQPHNGGDGGNGNGSLAGRVKLRPIGWLAYNTARIEAGTALFNIDFGPDALPAETGDETFADRVSLTKGCYLGQEVVARLHSQGRPKQVLVGLKPEGPGLLDEAGRARQPVGGAQVFRADDEAGDPVGVITSSTISPMLGGKPACFAVVKATAAEEGTGLAVPAEGAVLTGPARRALRFV